MILTVAAIKGGTGKTTTAAALAQAAAEEGRRVLAIDLDGQGDLTFSLDGNPNKWGSYELLDGADLSQTIQHTPQGVDLVPGTPKLANIHSKTGSARRLQKAIEPYIRGFELIIIDTPPTLGELTFNALQAATDLLIPLEADRHSLQGLYRITDIARQVKESNPKLNILGTIITRYDRRASINQFMRDTIAEKGEELGAPLLMEIRQAVAVKEAQALQKSLFAYAGRSKPAEDYRALYRMLTQK